jgi:hypothetical protein
MPVSAWLEHLIAQVKVSGSGERIVVKTFADLLLPKAHFSKRVERGGGYRAHAMAMAGTWQCPEHLNAQVKVSGSGERSS